MHLAVALLNAGQRVAQAVPDWSVIAWLAARSAAVTMRKEHWRCAARGRDRPRAVARPRRASHAVAHDLAVVPAAGPHQGPRGAVHLLAHPGAGPRWP